MFWPDRISRTEPMFTATEFSEKMPVPPQMKCCACCLKGLLPELRGLKPGSTPLPQHEVTDLLRQLDGAWKIKHLNTTLHNGRKIWADYEEATFDSGGVVLTCGMSGQGQRVVLAGGTSNAELRVQPNMPLSRRQELRFFRGPGGELYYDCIGSMLVDMDIAGGHLTMDNAFGIKMLLQRGWRDGFAPGQQNMAPMAMGGMPQQNFGQMPMGGMQQQNFGQQPMGGMQQPMDFGQMHFGQQPMGGMQMGSMPPPSFGQQQPMGGLQQPFTAPGAGF